MVLSYDTSDDRFGAYAKRQQQSALDKYQAPAKAWDNLQNLQNQAVAGQLDSAGKKEFKQARKDWNREYKNTPVGIMASGVNLDEDPFGAQNLYHDMSSQIFFDQPKLYDEMYPFSPNRFARAAGSLAENTLMGQMIKSIVGDREPKIPANVLAMRKRFPGINKVVPPSGIAPLVPEHIRNSTLGAINKVMDEGEGIFYGGRGELLPDFDREVTEVPTDTDINQAYNYLYNKEIYDFGAPISYEQFKESYGKDINYINSILRQKEEAEKMGLI